MKSMFMTLHLYILGVYAVCTNGAKCGQSEYLTAAGECCPMCVIGSVVLRDCHGDYSTTCQPCSKGTFMNEPNGLESCFPCKTCDTGGLYILQKCNTIQDTTCDVLDGYYCTNVVEAECSHAMKHSKCAPGQQMKSPGGKWADTVCEPCPPGFYSPEGVNCSKWTECSVNEILDQQGTFITDVKCKQTRARYGLIAALIVCILPFLIKLLLYLRHKLKRKRLRLGVQETRNDGSEYAPSTSKVDENQETDSSAVTGL